MMMMGELSKCEIDLEETKKEVQLMEVEEFKRDEGSRNGLEALL